MLEAARCFIGASWGRTGRAGGPPGGWLLEVQVETPQNSRQDQLRISAGQAVQQRHVPRRVAAAAVPPRLFALRPDNMCLTAITLGVFGVYWVLCAFKYAQSNARSIHLVYSLP